MSEIKLRIVFMGTPDFAVESLKALIEAGKNIVAVITAPDKPAGRGKKILSPPIKAFAEEAGIPIILQPKKLKDPTFIEELKAIQADLQLVVAFRMLPEVVWSMPAAGTINLHASLLPDYRGAAPINWAIINGEIETGTTTFFIEKDIDTGKIIFSEKIAIGDNTNAGELHDALMVSGAKLLVKTVDAIEAKNFPIVSQKDVLNERILHEAPKIFKESCRINWNNSAQQLHNFVRGMSPYPAAWTVLDNGETQIATKIFETAFEVKTHPETPGTLSIEGKDNLKVAVSDGYILIKSLQMAGKKRLSTNEFLRGFNQISTFKMI